MAHVLVSLFNETCNILWHNYENILKYKGIRYKENIFIVRLFKFLPMYLNHNMSSINQDFRIVVILRNHKIWVGTYL